MTAGPCGRAADTYCKLLTKSSAVLVREVQEAPCPRQEGRVTKAPPLLPPLPAPAERGSAAEEEEKRPPRLPLAPAVLEIPPVFPQGSR